MKNVYFTTKKAWKNVTKGVKNTMKNVTKMRKEISNGNY